MAWTPSALPVCLIPQLANQRPAQEKPFGLVVRVCAKRGSQSVRRARPCENNSTRQRTVFYVPVKSLDPFKQSPSRHKLSNSPAHNVKTIPISSSHHAAERGGRQRLIIARPSLDGAISYASSHLPRRILLRTRGWEINSLQQQR